MKNYLEVANETGLWIICSLMVIVVVIQAVIFMKKAYKTGIKMGLSSEQLNAGLRSGAITSIGPSIAIVIAMVSLILSIGGPMAWMRLSVIGSVPYELMAASTGAKAMGVELGGEGYDITAYANSVWTMTIGASGWLILVGLFADKFNDLRNYVVRGNTAFLPVLTVSAMIGAFAYFSAPYLVLKGIGSTAAAVTGGIVMLFVSYLSNTFKLNWLKEWALGIAMVVGMFTALLFI